MIAIGKTSVIKLEVRGKKKKGIKEKNTKKMKAETEILENIRNPKKRDVGEVTMKEVLEIKEVGGVQEVVVVIEIPRDFILFVSIKDGRLFRKNRFATNWLIVSPISILPKIGHKKVDLT